MGTNVFQNINHGCVWGLEQFAPTFLNDNTFLKKKREQYKGERMALSVCQIPKRHRKKCLPTALEFGAGGSSLVTSAEKTVCRPLQGRG